MSLVQKHQLMDKMGKWFVKKMFIALVQKF